MKELTTKRGVILVALAHQITQGREWVPLGDLRRLARWRPADAGGVPDGDRPRAKKFKRKKFARLIDELQGENLIQSAGGGSDDVRISPEGLEAIGVARCGPARVGPSPPAKRYAHVKDIPRDQLEDRLNKMAQSGWRVVTVSGHYASRDRSDGGDVLFWAVLERSDPAPD